MCDSCFSTEIESFEDYQSFEKFDIELIQKNETNNNDFGLKVIETNSFYSGFSFQIVKCNSCGTVWWFSVPDNSWRGFFLKEENAKIKITDFRKFDQRKRFIFAAFLIALLTLILISYLIKN